MSLCIFVIATGEMVWVDHIAPYLYRSLDGRWFYRTEFIIVKEG